MFDRDAEDGVFVFEQAIEMEFEALGEYAKRESGGEKPDEFFYGQSPHVYLDNSPHQVGV
jgi:hypothetical protein